MSLFARVEDIVVEREPGEPWAKAEIEVPDTRVFGRVVDDFDRPLPRAWIDISGPTASGGSSSDRIEAKGSDASFEHRGFAPGTWILEGRARPDLEAPPFFAGQVKVEVEEGVPAGPIELVARQEQKLTGRVVSPMGDNVPGAMVVAGLEQGPSLVTQHIRHQVTAVDGTFELHVPTGVAAVQLSVFPPGFAARQVRVELPHNGPLSIPVDPVGGTVIVVATSGDRAGEIPDNYLDLRSSLFGEYFYYVPFLRIWAGVHGVPREEKRLVVPNLEPGVYTACSEVSQQAFGVGYLPPGLESRCARGTLVPHGELVLEIPVLP